MIRFIFAIFMATSLVQAVPAESFEDVETFDFNLASMFPRLERQLVIGNTEELIKYLRSITPGNEMEDFIAILENPFATELVDGVLDRFPELPDICRGIRIFISGQGPSYLKRALIEVLVPILEEGRNLLGTVKPPLEKAGEVLAEQGVRLFLKLKDPQAVKEFQEFQALPEVLKLGQMTKEATGIDLLRILKGLEDVLAN